MTCMPRPPSLELLCQSFWLHYLRHQLCHSMGERTRTEWQRYLSALPGFLREEMLAKALRAPSTDDLLLRDRLTNNILLLLDCHVHVAAAVAVRVPAEAGAAPDDALQLVLNHGGGVQRLTVYVGSDSAGGDRDSSVKWLRRLLQVCRRVKRLQLVGAGDAELQLVAANCSQLDQLEVANIGRGSVTDAGVTSIVSVMAQKHTQLSRLNLTHVNLTFDTVMMLLKELPHLEFLGCPNLIGHLEQCDPKLGTLNLRELPEFHVTTDSVLYFSALCPYISTGSFVLQDQTFNLIQLDCFKHLKHMILRSKNPFNFGYSGLESALWKFGANLKSLCVSGDIYECIDIASMAVSCTSLLLLKVPALKCSNTLTYRALSAPVSFLATLTEYHCDRSAGVSVGAYRDLMGEVDAHRAVLQHGKHLRVVRVRPFPLTDEDMEFMIEQKSLQDLEVFEVGPTQLGFATAQALIDGCGRLQCLGALQQWRGLQLMQIVAIRALTRLRCRPVHLKLT